MVSGPNSALGEQGDHDPVATATIATFERRLQQCDPAMVGTYAEHLVARHLGGSVNEAGWGPVDVVWRPSDSTGVEQIDIQVKSARAFRTFGDGVVNNVTFSTRASRSLTDVWAQVSTLAARADIWVFALHGSPTLRDGWRFFVVAGSALDLLGQASISLNALTLRFGYPVTGAELQERVLTVHRDRTTSSHAEPTWSCGKCENSYDNSRSLAAHQAAMGHRIAATDLIHDRASRDSF